MVGINAQAATWLMVLGVGASSLACQQRNWSDESTIDTTAGAETTAVGAPAAAQPASATAAAAATDHANAPGDPAGTTPAPGIGSVPASVTPMAPPPVAPPAETQGEPQELTAVQKDYADREMGFGQAQQAHLAARTELERATQSERDARRALQTAKLELQKAQTKLAQEARKNAANARQAPRTRVQPLVDVSAPATPDKPTVAIANEAQTPH